MIGTIKQTIRGCSLLGCILAMSATHADLGDGLADVFSLGGHGRQRQRARAQSRLEQEQIRLQAATEFRLSEKRRVDDLLDEVSGEIEFLETLRNYGPNVTKFQSQIIKYVESKLEFWASLKRQLLFAKNANDDGRISLEMVTKRLRKSAESRGIRESCAEWDAAMNLLGSTMNDANRGVEAILKPLIDSASKLDIENFLQAVISTKFFMTTMFYEVDERIKILTAKKDGLLRQKEALQ